MYWKGWSCIQCVYCEESKEFSSYIWQVGVSIPGWGGQIQYQADEDVINSFCNGLIYGL